MNLDGGKLCSQYSMKISERDRIDRSWRRNKDSEKSSSTEGAELMYSLNIICCNKMQLPQTIMFIFALHYERWFIYEYFSTTASTLMSCDEYYTIRLLTNGVSTWRTASTTLFTQSRWNIPQIEQTNINRLFFFAFMAVVQTSIKILAEIANFNNIASTLNSTGLSVFS